MKIERIEPQNWFAGLRNPLLQLMLTGPGVASARQVTAAGSGARVRRVTRLDSPNYLFVDLDLSQARPGLVTLTVDGERVDYRLLPRREAGDGRQGLSHADVLYLLMPDRFAQGPHHVRQAKGLRPYREDRREPSLRHGGDLEGLCQHLDYFCELGVTALWLTPVQENNSADNGGRYSTYHGYAITDFYRVDPRLGTLDDYCRLADQAHRRGLKVVMDLVFNHCSIDHPWLSDLPSADWVFQEHRQTSYKLTPTLDPYAADTDRRDTLEGWFTDAMPALNLRQPQLLRYLVQCAKWWVETAGIDAIRMDTFPYVDATAMRLWMQEMKDEYPRFSIVGETWVTEPAFTAACQARGLSHPTDFALYDRMKQAWREDTDDWWTGLNRVYHCLCSDHLYRHPERVVAFLDNHDTDRFLAGGTDPKPLQQALTLLLVMRRTPQLYYGTELLMNGTTAETDGNVRRDFPGGFANDRRNAFSPGGRTRRQQAMFQWLSRLLHWRRGNAVIAHGTQKHFIPHQGVYVLARQWRKNVAMAVLNGTAAEATLDIDRYREVVGQASEATDVLTGRRYRLTADLRLRPRQTLLLEFTAT